jgi:hypothetical protein
MPRWQLTMAKGNSLKRFTIPLNFVFQIKYDDILFKIKLKTKHYSNIYFHLPWERDKIFLLFLSKKKKYLHITYTQHGTTYIICIEHIII